MDAEWLEADGLGGFASGTVGGVRTRRYHALLLAASAPPLGRVVLVNGFEAWAETGSGRIAITSQRYTPDILYPDGLRRLAGFSREPWPSWRFQFDEETALEQELFVAHDTCETVLRWRLRAAGSRQVRLSLRLLLSGRDYHGLHRENAAFSFAETRQAANVSWRPYAGLPEISALSNGAYERSPTWYRNFLYSAERERGLDFVEDLASPGIFVWDLGAEDAILILRAGECLNTRTRAHADALAATERTRRAQFDSPLARSADSYIADRGRGRTILAGFPWFGDWGRDTFIAFRGLALETGRLGDAARILSAWAETASEGMLPNRFPDDGNNPEYNSVDASLWFIIAVDAFLRRAGEQQPELAETVRAKLISAVQKILRGYAEGARYGIRMDGDGLLRAGAPGVQLTWMDAKTGDHVVTPRIGKPVEIQALWINALRIGGQWGAEWFALEEAAQASFLARFPDPETGGLFDVVDVDHQSGAIDRKIRPNQVFAVGGLPFAVVEGEKARGIVALAQRVLLTPLGLRSLASSDPDYQPHYRGGPEQRDRAYHQGTVWPWLIGPFVEAWLRVEGDTPATRARARDQFLAPLLAHLETAGLGHVSEVADGEFPHMPGGCPFQAWSLGELIRIERLLAAAAPSHERGAAGETG